MTVSIQKERSKSLKSLFFYIDAKALYAKLVLNYIMVGESLIKSIRNRMKILIVLVVILAAFVYFDAIEDIIIGESEELMNSWIVIVVMTVVIVLNILISMNLKKWSDFYVKKS